MLYGSNEIDVLNKTNYIDLLKDVWQTFMNEARALSKRMMGDLRNA